MFHYRLKNMVPCCRKSEHIMRKVIRGYAKDKNLDLILIGTIPVPHSRDKRSPAARQDKRYSVRQGATTFKKERFVSCPLQISIHYIRSHRWLNAVGTC